MPVPTHLRTTHVLSRQPWTVPQQSGIAKPVDLGGLGFEQSNWMSASATSASILRGNVRKTGINGSRGDSYSLGMSPDDHDNYERTEHGRELF